MRTSFLCQAKILAADAVLSSDMFELHFAQFPTRLGFAAATA